MSAEFGHRPDMKEHYRFRNPFRDVLPLAAITATIATAAAFLAPETAFAADPQVATLKDFTNYLLGGAGIGTISGAVIGYVIGCIAYESQHFSRYGYNPQNPLEEYMNKGSVWGLAIGAPAGATLGIVLYLI